MGREAAAEAEEQLLRRSLRLFAAGERSFRMDRLSPDADALRAAVADVLPRFLGSYTDDILAVRTCAASRRVPARTADLTFPPRPLALLLSRCVENPRG